MRTAQGVARCRRRRAPPIQPVLVLLGPPATPTLISWAILNPPANVIVLRTYTRARQQARVPLFCLHHQIAPISARFTVQCTVLSLTASLSRLFPPSLLHSSSPRQRLEVQDDRELHLTQHPTPNPNMDHNHTLSKGMSQATDELPGITSSSHR